MYTVRAVEMLTDATAHRSADLAATWPRAEPAFAEAFPLAHAKSARLARVTPVGGSGPT